MKANRPGWAQTTAGTSRSSIHAGTPVQISLVEAIALLTIAITMVAAQMGNALTQHHSVMTAAPMEHAMVSSLPAPVQLMQIAPQQPLTVQTNVTQAGTQL